MWQSGLMHHTWNMTYFGTMSSNLILSERRDNKQLSGCATHAADFITFSGYAWELGN